MNRRCFLQAASYGAAALAGASSARTAEVPERDVDNVLKEAMHRAGNCCLAWLEPQHDFLPTGGYEVAHDTGRWWDATLRLEATTRFVIPARLEAAMLSNIRRLMGNPDGSMRAEIIDPDNVGHNHSYLGTLRGLLLFGLLMRQQEYVAAVNATYRHSLWKHNISESGWTPHDLGKIRFPDEAGDPVGEHASCGDVFQLALWLALRAGQSDLLDDVDCRA